MSITKRKILSILRNRIKEVNADTLYTDMFLYYILDETSKWLIRREVKSGKLMQSKSVFQKIYCMPTIEVSKIDDKCPIHIDGLNIYRTEYKLPEMWETEMGPIIKRVLSIDSFTEFKVVSQSDWEVKFRNPYTKGRKEIYCFYEDGYLWFPQKSPKNINIEAFFKEDVSVYEFCRCGEITENCDIYLDQLYRIPDYIEAELIAKAFQQIAGETDRIKTDADINKNSNIKE